MSALNVHRPTAGKLLRSFDRFCLSAVHRARAFSMRPADRPTSIVNFYEHFTVVIIAHCVLLSNFRFGFPFRHSRPTGFSQKYTPRGRMSRYQSTEKICFYNSLIQTPGD